MNIILLGLPGSGKGTQSKFIKKKYNIPKISTGDLLRNIVKKKSLFSKKIKKIIDQGKLVDDNVIIKLFINRIKKNDCSKGFILDGFPRTITQDKYLENSNIKIDLIFEFLISENLSINRISGRRIHTASGRIYHTVFNPPKKNEKDDFTGDPLIIREDDKKEILKRRIQEYKKLTIPLINYYKKNLKKRNIKYLTINGMLEEKLINKEIDSYLINFL